jgi:methionyl-tRNA formyltransferase
MTAPRYEYSQGDMLETPLKYTYTAFRGAPFLEAWRAARAGVRADLGEARAPLRPERPGAAPQGATVETALLLEFLAAPGGDAAGARRWLGWMIQRFEVSKRVHSAYELRDGRVKSNGDYRAMDLYLRLGEVLAGRAEAGGHLPALNALLKCLDTLCSQRDRLDALQKARLAWLLEAETRLVEAARKPRTGAAADIDPPARPRDDLGAIPRVAFLAADTMRSRGYAQALVASGARLGRVVIVNVPGGAQRLGQSDAAPSSDGSLGAYFVPDLDIPLEETCKMLSDNVVILETGTVNAPDVIAALPADAFDFIVYSGFGGELVGRDLLDDSAPLLHMHAGWLPDYRGSTTTFYSWLRDGTCGASAICLSAQIDQGEILGRKRYPPPPVGMDIDYLHDAVLRSDLLLSVMTHLARTGELPQPLSQQAEEGDTYYIIHPVLKHLAILSG